MFAVRFDKVRRGDGEQRLSEDDVVRLLELAARKGSVTAMRTLLDRFKGASGAGARDHAHDEFDELKARRARVG